MIMYAPFQMIRFAISRGFYPKNNNIRAIQTEFYLGQTNTHALSGMSSNTTKNKLFKQKLINWDSFFYQILANFY